MNLAEKQQLIENTVRELFYKDNNNHISSDKYYQIRHTYHIFIIGDIKFLNSVSHRWGCCKRRRHVYYFTFNNNYIENASIEECKELAIHEVSHAINYIKYLGKGHDKSFYKVCKMLGSIKPVRCSDAPTSEMKHVVKYVYKCSKCGRLFTKARKLKGKYTHSRDKGLIELVLTLDKKHYMSDDELNILYLKHNLKVA